MKSSNQGSSENFGFHDDEKFKKRFDLFKEIIESGQVVTMKDNLEDMLDECLETGHYRKAMFIVNNLLSTFPYDSELWFKRSICCFGRGDKKGHLSSLNKVLALNPVHTEALVEKAKFYLNKDKPSRAVGLLSKAYRINPTDDIVLVGISSYFRLTSRPKKAVKYLRKAVLLHPDNIEYYEELAACYEDSGRITESFEIYQQYLELYPDDEYGWYALGLQYFRFQHYRRAKQAFIRAIEILPGYHDAAVSLAHTYFEMGDYPRAYQEYKKLGKDADFPEEVPLNLISLFLEQKKYRAALRQADRVIASHPGSIRAYTLKALCLYKLQGRKAAEKFVTGIFHIYMTGHFSAMNRAPRYIPEEAFIRFSRNDKKFKDYHHLDSKLLRILHSGYKARKQSKQSYACLTTLVNRTKFKPETFYQLALLEIEQGNSRRALQYLRKLKKSTQDDTQDNIIRDNHPDIYFSKVFSLLMKGK